MTQHDAIVIGAGPYGLAASHALRSAGADVRTFGETMSFWQQHMPKGMFLRSPWDASHIGGPFLTLSLDSYQRDRNTTLARPIPLDDFVAYGKWFAERGQLGVERRRVSEVDKTNAGFRVVLDDGEAIDTRRVVVAMGIKEFALRPAEFSGASGTSVTHVSDHSDLSQFAAKHVAVIGGGQSALESAVLLHEIGADVELLMRGRGIHWVGRVSRSGLLGRLLFHRNDVGPGLVSQVVARPGLFRRLPTTVQRRLMRRSLVPGGAMWLRQRLAPLAISFGRSVVAATGGSGDRVRLLLDDGMSREFDHVFLATGYRMDLRRLRILSAPLLSAIRQVAEHPVLGPGFESSVPGLHFLGAPAVHSFGPIFRFVCGTEFAAPALSRAVVGARTTARETRSYTAGAAERNA